MILPFPGDLTSTANGLLLLSLAAAILYGFAQSQAAAWRRSVVKSAAVGLLAVLSFVQDGPILLTAALAASAGGDAALSRPGDCAFMAGLAAFLLAHLVFVALFVGRWWGVDLATWQWWRLAAGILLLALCGFMLRRLLPAVGPRLRWLIAGHVAANAAMGLSALGVPGWGVPLGAGIFVASDVILATDRFLLPQDFANRSWVRLAVWALYYTGQALITLALLT